MKRVLIVDDEAEFRALARTVLENMGLKVAEAADGVQGLRAAYEAVDQQDPFDLVLLDLNMSPGWGGDDTAAKLVELSPRPKIILCTGSTHDPMLNYADAFGIDTLLEKPFPISQLREVVSRMLELGQRA